METCHEAWSQKALLSTEHLAGVRIVRADNLSRLNIESHDWELQKDVLKDKPLTWSTPDIDLFATLSNRKCEVFCSRGGMYQGSQGDALAMGWSLFSLPFVFAHTPILG